MTQTMSMDDQRRGGEMKKAKLIITMKKHADFDKNYEEFQKSRQEAEEQRAKKETAGGPTETKK